MTGRGRPRKAKSPDTNCDNSKTKPKETKQVCLTGCPGKDFTEARQNGTTKEQKPKEQKKTNHTEEKPSVRGARKEKTTNHSPEEINKQERTPTDNTKPPVQGTKAKTCVSRAKTAKQCAEEITKTQPETTKDTTKDSLKTAKAKTCGKTKLKEELSEEMMKMQPETRQDTTKDKATKAKTRGGEVKPAVIFDEKTIKMQPETLQDTTKDKATKAKTRGGEVKPAVKFDEKTIKMQPETLQDTTKDKATKAKTRGGEVKPAVKFDEKTIKIQPETLQAREPQHWCKDKAAVDTILSSTLAKLKIKRNDRSDTSQVINEIIKTIITHLKQNTQCFKDVEEPLRTGSYYENLKISNPDEFDVMLPIPVDRVTTEPFGEDGAFYSVELKRGNRTLQKFQETTTLSASKMLEEFRDEVKKSVKGFKEWELTKKKKGCPAVTLIRKVQSITISLDVVLCLMVKSSWPPFTNKGLKIEGWLGTKVKQEYKRKAYYLVPKYEGKGTVELDGVLAKDVWRVSFSHIEKAILKNHGSEKTCCEKGGAPCCRKDCLKLLKHLLSLLKEREPSFDKFCSYHAKTTLLHACCSRTKDSDWRASDLSHCFQLLLMDFVARLEDGELYNFFIPTQNLLLGPGQKKCTKLAQCIKKECENGFPIFK